MTVKPRLTERIDPRHDPGELFELGTHTLRIDGRSLLIDRRNITVRGGGGDRALVGSGKHGQPPVRFDTDRYFRADQIEALGSQLADEQASARKSDFRFRRTCDNRPIDIADHDVANPHRRSSLFIALEQMIVLVAAVWAIAPSPRTTSWVVAACGYVCFFTGIPVVMYRIIAPQRVTPLRLRVTVLVVMAASLVLPDLIHYLLSQKDILDVAFSFRHLINPFRTLSEWRTVEGRGWIPMPFAIGLAGVVSWLVLIQLG